MASEGENLGSKRGGCSGERDGWEGSSSDKEEDLTKCGQYSENFRRQTIPAWEPILSPNVVIFGFFLISGALLLMGITLVAYSSTVVECYVDYPSPDDVNNPAEVRVVIDKEDCRGLNRKELPADVLFMYYALDGFYQNHRRYVKSISYEQLKGKVFTSGEPVKACEPEQRAPDGRILSPCGLMARSLFNDTYTVYTRLDKDDNSIEDANLTQVVLDETTDTIVWQKDYTTFFANPKLTPAEGTKVDEWIDETIFPGKVENPHFRNWMKLAFLPDFRKLYAKVLTQGISLPIVVKIQNRFPAKGMQAKKSIVLSTMTWDGAQSTLLSALYIVFGSFCGFIGLLFLRRNRKNPRIIGDIRYLSWTRIGGQG